MKILQVLKPYCALSQILFGSSSTFFFSWLQKEWNPEQRCFIFILAEDVTEAARALPISPNIEGAVNIDLDTFNLWEGDAIFDPMSGHWNMVAVIGNDFDAYLFVSVALSPKLPNFYTYLKGR